MPRHWKEPGEPGEPEHSDPWYDVRELTTGQAVQLRQSLLRLESRAHGKVWPEYSELQCYACHHSLTLPENSWRQARGYPGRRPGDPPWNPSRYAVFHEIVFQVDGDGAGKLDSELSRLAQLMSQLNPDREAVAASAASCARLVGDLSCQGQTRCPTIRHPLCACCGKFPATRTTFPPRANMPRHKPPWRCNRCSSRMSETGNSQNSAELRAAISALFQDLQDPSAYDPARFSGKCAR